MIDINVMERPKPKNNKEIDIDPLDNDIVGLSKKHSINNPYIQLANRYPLLVKRQEQMLFKFKENSPFSNDIIKDPKFIKLFPKEATELVNNLQYDSKSPEHTAELCNMKLVAKWAQKYIGQGLSLDDLTSEGQLGLIRAIHKFDYRKNLKFSTYATWWIRQSIMRGIADHGKAIRIPEHTVDQIKVYYKQSRILEQELGRQPTIPELAAVMGLSEDRLGEIILGSMDPVSLNIPVGEGEEDDNIQLKDLILDENQTSTDLLVEHKMQRMELRNFLSVLNKRELKVLASRFGFYDGRDHTLEEVGKEFGLTRERIRQIELKALGKVENELRKAGITRTADLFTV